MPLTVIVSRVSPWKRSILNGGLIKVYCDSLLVALARSDLLFLKFKQARLLSFPPPLLSTRLAHMSTEDSMPDGNHLYKSDCTAAHQVTAEAVLSILRQGICSASLHRDVAPA